MTQLEFHITCRTGRWHLVCDGELIGLFASEAAATDMAIRFAQDQNATYTIWW